VSVYENTIGRWRSVVNADIYECGKILMV